MVQAETNQELETVVECVCSLRNRDNFESKIQEKTIIGNILKTYRNARL